MTLSCHSLCYHEAQWNFRLAKMTEKVKVQIMAYQPTIFIFGLGFTGTKLARMLVEKGWHVRGTKRGGMRPDSGIHALPSSVEVFNFAADEPISDPDRAFAGVTHVLSTIAVIGGTDPVLAAHGTALSTIKAERGLWAGYVSATSVYTEADGGWVNEDSPTDAISTRGQWRRQAEMDWQDQLGAEIFRAAGIYGAGRSAFQALLSGKARIIRKPGHLFNRIHVTDLARIIIAAMEQPMPCRVLNCADGNPSEAGEVIRKAAEMLGVDAPDPVDFADADMSAMARSFYATARCVDSSKLKSAIGLDLLYPDYHAGLAATLKEEQQLGLIRIKVND